MAHLTDGAAIAARRDATGVAGSPKSCASFSTRMTSRRGALRLSAMAAIAAMLGSATAEADDLPQLANLGRRGIPLRFKPWRQFKERHPDQVPRDNAVLTLDRPTWDQLRLAVVFAPMLPYDAALNKWEIREDAGNCAVRTLTVRAFLARHRIPLGAVRPALCYRGTLLHMGNIVMTDRGDLFIDSIANILQPAWQAPYRWYARWVADEIWEELEPSAGQPA